MKFDQKLMERILKVAKSPRTPSPRDMAFDKELKLIWRCLQSSKILHTNAHMIKQIGGKASPERLSHYFENDYSYTKADKFYRDEFNLSSKFSSQLNQLFFSEESDKLSKQYGTDKVRTYYTVLTWRELNQG